MKKQFNILLTTILTFTSIGALSLIPVSDAKEKSSVSETASPFTADPDVTVYSASRASESSNSVTYSINYLEDNYYYIHQPDYVPPNWVETIPDIYGWVLEPTWTWTQTITDPLDPDYNAFPPDTFGWSWVQFQLIESYDNWDWVGGTGDHPSSHTGWEYLLVDPGLWGIIQDAYYGWDNTGYWPQNKFITLQDIVQDVWVDYSISTNNSTITSGRQDLTTYLNYVSPPSTPRPPIGGDIQDPNAPSVNWPTGGDSVNGARQGYTGITFTNLNYGWEYTIDLELKYKNHQGNTITHDVFVDTFTTVKTDPTAWIDVLDVGNNYASFNIKINDIDSTRITPINWRVEEVMSSNVVDEGVVDSADFTITSSQLNTDMEYQVYADFEYKNWNTQSPQTYSFQSQIFKPVNTQAPIIEIENAGFFDATERGVYLSFDIKMDPTLKTHYYETQFEENSTVQIVLFDDNNNVISQQSHNELQVGTNAFYFETREDKYSAIITVNSPGFNTLNPILITGNRTTNVSPNSAMVLHNVNETNNSATLRYSTIFFDHLLSIENIEYRINGNWYQTNHLSEYGFIEITDLNENTDYETQLRMETSSENTIYSNTINFTTDNNTRVDVSLESVTSSSASFNVIVENLENMSNNILAWEVIQNKNGNYSSINSGSLTLEHNGLSFINITQLIQNNEYEFWYKYEVEGIQIIDSIKFETSYRLVSSRIKSFSYSVFDQNNISFTIDKIGDVFSLEHSLNGTTWQTTIFNENNDKLTGLIDVNDSKNFQEIHFRLNYESLNTYHWYRGNDTNIFIPPKKSLPVNQIILWTVISVSSVAMVSFAGVGYWWYKKDKPKKSGESKKKQPIENIWMSTNN